MNLGDHHSVMQMNAGSGRKYSGSAKERILSLCLPLEEHLSPFEVELSVRTGESNLKNAIQENQWVYEKVFHRHSPVMSPGFSAFRRALDDIDEEFNSSWSIQILLLKCEGYRFPRNPHARIFETLCGAKFYGPMICTLNYNYEPYALGNFSLQQYRRLEAYVDPSRCQSFASPQYSNMSMVNPAGAGGMNRLHPNGHMNGSAGNTPTLIQGNGNVGGGVGFQQQHGQQQEVDLDLLATQMSTEMFYMYRYKTEWCPKLRKGINHEWTKCLYAHRVHDYRRPPEQYRYLAKSCPYGEMCENMMACNFAHSKCEKLYHPSKYRTNPCDQSYGGSKTCLRGAACAFYHSNEEKRQGDDSHQEIVMHGPGSFHSPITNQFSPQPKSVQYSYASEFYSTPGGASEPGSANGFNPSPNVNVGWQGGYPAEMDESLQNGAEIGGMAMMGDHESGMKSESTRWRGNTLTHKGSGIKVEFLNKSVVKSSHITEMCESRGRNNGNASRAAELQTMSNPLPLESKTSAFSHRENFNDLESTRKRLFADDKEDEDQLEMERLVGIFNESEKKNNDSSLSDHALSSLVTTAPTFSIKSTDLEVQNNGSPEIETTEDDSEGVVIGLDGNKFSRPVTGLGPQDKQGFGVSDFEFDFSRLLSQKDTKLIEQEEENRGHRRFRNTKEDPKQT